MMDYGVTGGLYSCVLDFYIVNIGARYVTLYDQHDDFHHDKELCIFNYNYYCVTMWYAPQSDGKFTRMAQLRIYCCNHRRVRPLSGFPDKCLFISVLEPLRLV